MRKADAEIRSPFDVENRRHYTRGPDAKGVIGNAAPIA
jgi:hypothetical protein